MRGDHATLEEAEPGDQAERIGGIEIETTLEEVDGTRRRPGHSRACFPPANDRLEDRRSA
jgi:hypothetical protein